MKSKTPDPLGTRTSLSVGGRRLEYYSINALEKNGVGPVSRLPFAVKVLLESVLRHVDGFLVTEEDVAAVLAPAAPASAAPAPAQQAHAREIPFMPARVLVRRRSAPGLLQPRQAGEKRHGLRVPPPVCNQGAA